ncbi:tail fiber protein [Laribacter hongkongensis]|uniref:phage tail protein n=1 Tax=Laribacter hongkongensis TaxID=168471 RepID=UPI001EFC7B86|nr:tail fiber protein [Laribacter hongkongensis]MCG9057077.1 tail fiber protein [Laribacter hongkongensis]MCG9076140.1 tail fiber protein [Laribacter hongkongensis]
MDAFTGEIRLFPFNYAPQNWAFCDGSTLLVQQNPALYSVIGTAYGGTPGVNFKLPNLNGRVAMGAGDGLGLTPWAIGGTAGADQVMLQPVNFASHTHRVLAKDGSEILAALDKPNNEAFLAQPRNIRLYNTTAPTSANPGLAAGTVDPAGTTQTQTSVPRSTMQPFLTLSYCICVDGEYPVRP